MTPNLGQGGCTALEDAVVLARQLAPVLLAQKAQQWGSQATSGPPEGAIAAALRAYEAERSRRCLPLTVRSYAMGAALQIPLTPVVEVRDAFIQHAFRPGHFLDHTGFDAGRLAAVV
jgi:2-polyprenyl-6-methoxyphenol hydroxylase-like FAD-dependent oxidoreductase